MSEFPNKCAVHCESQPSYWINETQYTAEDLRLLRSSIDTVLASNGEDMAMKVENTWTGRIGSNVLIKMADKEGCTLRVIIDVETFKNVVGMAGVWDD